MNPEDPSTPDRTRYGLHLREGLPTVGFGRLIEGLGFDYVACGEHVMFHQPAANAMVRLAAVAGATSRVRLLSSLVLAPLYPAALLAKMAAELDHVSDGRFSLGIGLGGEFPAEFEACNVPVNERGARTDEALELIAELLSERGVNFDGRFNRVRDFTIEPRPVQTPRPPIWVGGRSEAAIHRAARFGDVWLPYFVTPENLERGVSSLAARSQALGRDPGAVDTAAFLFVAVSDKRERAMELAELTLAETYRQDFSRLVDKYVVVGSVEDCRNRLAEYRGAGARTIILSLACPPEDGEEMARLLAEEVLRLDPAR